MDSHNLVCTIVQSSKACTFNFVNVKMAAFGIYAGVALSMYKSYLGRSLGLSLPSLNTGGIQRYHSTVLIDRPEHASTSSPPASPSPS
jgi:hypothetical protein